MSILSSFLSGNTKSVWDLISYTDISNFELTDVHEICKITCIRASNNIRIMHQYLQDNGYEFMHPECSFVPQSSKRGSELRLPLLVSTWYSLVKSIDFSQSDNQLYSKSGYHTFSGLGFNCTAIIQDSESSRSRAIWLYENDYISLAESKTFFHLGGWASNSEPIGFDLTTNSVNPVVFNDGDGDYTFYDFLSLLSQTGCFPFWTAENDSELLSNLLPSLPKYEEYINRIKPLLNPI